MRNVNCHVYSSYPENRESMEDGKVHGQSPMSSWNRLSGTSASNGRTLTFRESSEGQLAEPVI